MSFTASFATVYSECSSLGFSVAPIPSSIIAAESTYNATQTNNIIAMGTTLPTPAFTSNSTAGSASQTTSTKVGGVMALDSHPAALLAMVISAILVWHGVYL
jgi:hypothetical protein